MKQLGRAQGEFYGQNLEQGRKDEVKEEFKASHYALGQFKGWGVWVPGGKGCRNSIWHGGEERRREEGRGEKRRGGKLKVEKIEAELKM